MAKFVKAPGAEAAEAPSEVAETGTPQINVAEGIPGLSEGDQPVVDGFGTILVGVAAVLLLVSLLVVCGFGSSAGRESARDAECDGGDGGD